MNFFTLDLILTDKKLYKGPATQITVPAEDGDLGILVNHMPIVAKLCQGKVRVLVRGEVEKVFEIDGGYLEMIDNHCTILASVG
jgi:F-type H+-transporting ATPase subunit epsilon